MDYLRPDVKMLFSFFFLKKSLRLDFTTTQQNNSYLDSWLGNVEKLGGNSAEFMTL